MKRSSFPCWLALLLASAAPGCAGRIADEPDSSEDPSCRTTLGARLVRHVCSHTENGPYAEVAAQSGGSGPTDVSQLHKPFDVTAVNVPFSLSYGASREGTHVIFTDKPTEWEVSSADGSALDVRTNVAAPSDGAGSCAGTKYAALVELQRGLTYVLSSPNASKRFILFIEHADTFGADAFVNSCSSDGS